MGNIIVIIVVSFTLFVFVAYTAINIYRRFFNKAYEKKYVDAYQNITEKDFDKAIFRYKDIISSVGNKNPILINTYLLLSEVYQKKGDVFFDEALQAIDNAIEVVKNKAINKEDTYVKQALLYKIKFLKKNNKITEANTIVDELYNLFPNDLMLHRKLKN